MSQSTQRLHPLKEFTTQLLGRLDDLATTPAWSTQPDARRRTLEHPLGDPAQRLEVGSREPPGDLPGSGRPAS